jgi:hypothetical protein
MTGIWLLHRIPEPGVIGRVRIGAHELVVDLSDPAAVRAEIEPVSRILSRSPPCRGQFEHQSRIGC